MTDPQNLDRVAAIVELDAVIAKAEPKFWWLDSLQLPYVSYFRCHKFCQPV
jgi:hypothetical protein